MIFSESRKTSMKVLTFRMDRVHTWFPALRCRFRIRFRKNRVHTCRSVNTVAGACSAAGPVGRPASFPRKRVGGALGVLAAETEK